MGRPEAEGQLVVLNTTETEDGVASYDKTRCSINASLVLLTSLEETVQDADWWTFAMEEILGFHLKDNH